MSFLNQEEAITIVIGIHRARRGDHFVIQYMKAGACVGGTLRVTDLDGGLLNKG
jgi:hypothetical protein